MGGGGTDEPFVALECCEGNLVDNGVPREGDGEAVSSVTDSREEGRRAMFGARDAGFSLQSRVTRGRK